MAQKIEHVLVSDLTGEELDEGETVLFGLDGVEYEIDLDEPEAADLREALAKYVAAARRTGGRAKRGTAKTTTGMKHSRETNRQIRSWGKAQGYELSDRGRVPSEVTEAWEKAHAGQAA